MNYSQNPFLDPDRIILGSAEISKVEDPDPPEAREVFDSIWGKDGVMLALTSQRPTIVRMSEDVEVIDKLADFTTRALEQLIQDRAKNAPDDEPGRIEENPERDLTHSQENDRSVGLTTDVDTLSQSVAAIDHDEESAEPYFEPILEPSYVEQEVILPIKTSPKRHEPYYANPIGPQPNLDLHNQDAIRQEISEQADLVVEGLLERIELVISDRLEQGLDEARVSSTEIDSQIKATLTKFVSNDLPEAIRNELGDLLHTELAKIIANELSTVAERFSRESTRDLTKLGKNITKISDRFESLEMRLSKIEGAVEKEIVVKFPKGMVNVTVPEREVNVAAPTVNVEAPKVVFGKDSIGVTLQKSGDKIERRIEFARDKDNNITSAKIADAGDKSKSEEIA